MIEERPCARMFCFCDRFASKNVGGTAPEVPAKYNLCLKRGQANTNYTPDPHSPDMYRKTTPALPERVFS